MSSSQTVQSVDRALDILSAVAEAPRGLSLRDLSGQLKLKPTTLHNLARTLTLRGYLAKVGKPPVYRLGPMPFQLTAASSDQLAPAEAAVRAVSEKCPWASVLYSEWIGAAVVTVLRADPEHPGILQRPRNEMHSPYASATLLAFQAFCTREQLSILRSRYPLAEFGQSFWSSERKLDKWLATVRKSGQCMPEVGDRQLLRIAVPMRDAHGTLTGILGASTHNATARQRKTLSATLRRAARAA